MRAQIEQFPEMLYAHAHLRRAVLILPGLNLLNSTREIPELIDPKADPPTDIETYRGVVYPSELDHMGHMNVQWYTAKFDSATWQFFSAVGITSGYMSENHMGMAALEQTIRYQSEAMAGNLLHVRSRALDISNRTLRFLHTMYNSETRTEIATCELVAAHLDRTLRKSCPLPNFVGKRCGELFHFQDN